MSLDTLSDRDTTISVRDSIVAPSTAGAPVSTSSEDEGEEEEVESSEESEEVESETEERLDWASVSERSRESEDTDSEGAELERAEKEVDWAGISQSRKMKSQSTMDSDAWHSESEANWTLVEASFRNGRDIAQSQVLSEGQDQLMPPSQEGSDAKTQSQILSEDPGIPQSRESLDAKHGQTMGRELEISYSGGVAQRRASVTFSEPPPTKELLKDPLSPFWEQDEEECLVQAALPVIPPSPPSPPLENIGSETQNLVAPEAVAKAEFDFYPARPTEIFGSYSWNTLPLAVTSSLVRQVSSSGE
jgi:hypothetical protein